MNLDLVNNVFNNLKDNKFVQNFINELSNYLENNNSNNIEYKWNNLISEDLILYDNKIISKFKNEMLILRNNILQKYADDTKELGDMYYIYNTSENEKNAYNICIYNQNTNNKIITKEIEKLPEGATLGSVLRKLNEKFILDTEAAKKVAQEINIMIKEKIEEQNKYLDSKRIDGHIYEVGEKYSERIWLYDLEKDTKGGIEEIEEIKFPKNLYENAKTGDLFIYKNGEYKKWKKGEEDKERI